MESVFTYIKQLVAEQSKFCGEFSGSALPLLEEKKWVVLVHDANSSVRESTIVK
jgi:hypothetical protein